MAWIFASIMILHVFFADGDSRHLFSVTWHGVYSGLMVGCKFMLIVLGAAILTLTTVPLRLTDGIAEILRPLRKIRLPVTQLPIMILITLHFIPVLFWEAQKLISAQKARGAKLEGANILRRLKNLLPIFAPLLRNSFRWADELAMGMESRCYSGGARSHLYALTFSRTDGIALTLTAVMILVTIAVNEMM